jgi:aryl-alcohol dehydrogenase-like predicted oxidoreductase
MIPQRPYGPLSVSALGFGGGALDSLDDSSAERLIHGCLDLGITLFDTAPSYGASEDRLGRFLASRRNQVVLSTKGGYGVPGVPDWTGEVIRQGVDQALRKLRTDRIDLFHFHSCPLETLQREELLRALEDAVAAGKVRVGAYSGENEALEWAVDSGRFGGVQTSINLFDQRSLHRGVRRAAARGLGVIAKRPIANAAWRHPEQPKGDYAEPYWLRMREMAQEPEDWLDTAIRFTAFAPGVTSCIVGSRNLEHLAQLAKAIERGPLPEKERERWETAFHRCDRGWTGQV